MFEKIKFKCVSRKGKWGVIAIGENLFASIASTKAINEAWAHTLNRDYWRHGAPIVEDFRKTAEKWRTN